MANVADDNESDRKMKRKKEKKKKLSRRKKEEKNEGRMEMNIDESDNDNVTKTIVGDLDEDNNHGNKEMTSVAEQKEIGNSSEEVVPRSSSGDGDNKNDDSDVKEEENGIVTKITFEELGVVESLCESCKSLNWTHASKIQKEVLPHALAGRDIIGLAETGSGKTGAFALPVLQGLLKNPRRGAVLAVILAPTRELAFQIHECFVALGSGVGATCVCVVGGIDMASQAIALARNPHVVTATPGRLVDHLTHTKGFHLRHVQYLVMDEADRMLGMDFEEELDQILNVLPTERVTMLFSATMTSKVQKLQRASLANPVKVQVSTKFQTPSKLIQNYLFIPAKYKDVYLTYLVNEHAGQTMLVFGATCNNVQRIAMMLRNLGFPAVSLHGQMSQPKRLGALSKFKSKSRDILICTDVASRGLDIPNVDVVINFDLPSHGKEYIHRVGRTARAGKSGKAIAMVTQYDVEIYQRLENLLQQRLPELKLDEQVVLLLHERVSEAQRLASRELKEQLAAASKHGNRKKRKNNFDDNDATSNLQQEILQSYGKSNNSSKSRHNNQNRKKIKGWVGRGGQRNRY